MTRCEGTHQNYKMLRVHFHQNQYRLEALILKRQRKWRTVLYILIG